MNDRLTVTKCTCALMLSIALIFPELTSAAESTGAKPADSARKEVLKEKGKAVVQEAVDAVRETEKALKALENEKPKEALSALETAAGKLDIVLSRQPELGLVPVDYQTQVFDVDADLKSIKATEKQLAELIDTHRYQVARSILDDLASEIRVTVVNVPLATYPVAIREIVPLIDAGKIDEAKDALYAVLGTLVITEEVIPLPIVRAEALLSEAFRIEHASDLSKEKSRETIEALVDDASTQIKVAETLGYGDRADYKVLYEGIDALKKTIRGEAFAAELDTMRKALSTFKNKVLHAGR